MTDDKNKDHEFNPDDMMDDYSGDLHDGLDDSLDDSFDDEISNEDFSDEDLDSYEFDGDDSYDDQSDDAKPAKKKSSNNVIIAGGIAAAFIVAWFMFLAPSQPIPENNTQGTEQPAQTQAKAGFGIRKSADFSSLKPSENRNLIYGRDTAAPVEEQAEEAVTDLGTGLFNNEGDVRSIEEFRSKLEEQAISKVDAYGEDQPLEIATIEPPMPVAAAESSSILTPLPEGAGRELVDNTKSPEQRAHESAIQADRHAEEVLSSILPEHATETDINALVDNSEMVALETPEVASQKSAMNINMNELKKAGTDNSAELVVTDNTSLEVAAPDAALDSGADPFALFGQAGVEPVAENLTAVKENKAVAVTKDDKSVKKEDNKAALTEADKNLAQDLVDVAVVNDAVVPELPKVDMAKAGELEAVEKKLKEAQDKIAEQNQELARLESLEKTVKQLELALEVKAKEAPASSVTMPVVTTKAPERAAPKKAANTHKDTASVSAPKAQAAKQVEVSAIRWEMKSAQAGKAVLSRAGQQGLTIVTVGQYLPGLGVINNIYRGADGWIVEGTQGRVKQN
jgi:hypothetical protein